MPRCAFITAAYMVLTRSYYVVKRAGLQTGVFQCHFLLVIFSQGNGRKVTFFDD